MADARPLAEPQFHSFRDLPKVPDDSHALFREMAHLQHENGATFFRFTIVSPEHPNPPYPHGLYTEGWEVDPAKMDPPHRCADFHPHVTVAGGN